MVLKLYLDLMSQPSRALYILFKSAKCDFEKKLVDLRKGEHFTDEFTAINRLQKVPVIEHDGFILTESVAIIKYLSRENLIPDVLYPKESKLQARIDEFLEWQHLGLRQHCAMFFRVKILDPTFTGKAPDVKTLLGYEKRMISALETFEKHWLQNGTQFVAGDTITVADLLAACELEQPRAAGYEPADNFKGISTWWKKVPEHFNPYYDEAHVVINKVTEKNKLAAKL
ncbi:glutathione S-transferase theta-1-like [Pararge aegeria]|uniref:Jg24105 protein n=2 Tax=Pararge aegeria TaxID=116150 RepID=A0A8S4R3A2_9NEOP|nr:glutathione S-transferase theta-1-like [Pararge aegeria]XP_039764308.1 glutathione S-transferase theta-1-like [Pararge aegeria]XP_039764329.1 glutathione S-transferase theta-1-like [Pararge aegeria]CAH2230329.1 jg24105 [Pararge aegeria aegeria]